MLLRKHLEKRAVLHKSREDSGATHAPRGTYPISPGALTVPFAPQRPGFHLLTSLNSEKQSTIQISKRQENDNGGQPCKCLHPMPYHASVLPLQESNYREANKKRKDGGLNQPRTLSVLCGCVPSPLHCQVGSLCGDCWTDLSRALRPYRGHCLGERDHMHLRPHSRAKRKLFLAWIIKG